MVAAGALGLVTQTLVATRSAQALQYIQTRVQTSHQHPKAQARGSYFTNVWKLNGTCARLAPLRAAEHTHQHHDEHEHGKLEGVGRYGPKAILLVGMSKDDGKAVQTWFNAMAPEYAVWPATPEQLDSDEGLGTVLGHPRDPSAAWPQVPADTPPVVIFSGMTGKEMIVVCQHWTQFTGLEQPAFAGACKANFHKSLRDLIPELIRSLLAAQRSMDDGHTHHGHQRDFHSGALSHGPPQSRSAADDDRQPIVIDHEADMQGLKDRLQKRMAGRAQRRQAAQEEHEQGLDQRPPRQHDQHRGFG
ncbi:hypothetical protein ACKKBF_B01875 [Auxenochlorella protothecoides x Auxenochlorella symbiontica]